MKAIQDFYPEEFAHCYGCGRANARGLHLKSYVDGTETVARFTPADLYSGGYPGHVYGGMIASLLDCHGTASAAAFALRERDLEWGHGQDPIRFVTASLRIEYKRPTPLGVELVIRGSLSSLDGRKATIALSLSAADELCASAEMLAIEYRRKTRAP